MAAWMLHGLCFGEEAGARNLAFFLCKVAAAGDERYLMCAAVAAAVVWFLLCVLQQVVVPVCVVRCVSWSCGFRSHWNGCMNVACSVLWGGSRSRKPCVFPCKVAAAGDERCLVCAAVAAVVLWFLLCVLQQVVVPVCVVLFVSWSCGCRSHWNGCMNVAWALFWGGSRSTKPCIFPCKVAAAGDEGYLLCAAVAAAVVWFLLCVLQQVVVPVCVVLFVSWSCGCRSHWNGCMNVARSVLWGGSRSRKPCVFPCKVAAAGDERYLLCAAVAAAVGLPSFLLHCNGGFKLLWLCLCVCVFIGCLESVVADRMNVAWALFWGGSQSTKPCVFPCKVAAAGDERYLLCAAVAAAVLWFLLCVLQQVVVPVCVVLFVSWSCGCRSHWNGCMNVACSVLWGGSRSRKPCVFPCKVAAAGDERYLLCAAVAAAVVWFLLCVLQQVVVPVCVVLFVSWSCGCRSHWNGCMNVACSVLWGGSRSRKPCVFPCKVAAAGDERYLVCAAVAAAVVWFLLCVLQQVVVPVCVVLFVSWSCGCRSHWNGCMNVACSVLWGGSRSRKPCVFPCKVAAAGDERYLLCAAGLLGRCGVWRVQWEVWSAKCEVELQMWHVKQDTTFAECTHARAWLAHGACKFYRWERSYIYIYIPKATSAPPRAGTTGSYISSYGDGSKPITYYHHMNGGITIHWPAMT